MDEIMQSEFWQSQWERFNSKNKTPQTYSRAGIWDKMSSVYGKGDDERLQHQKEKTVKDLLKADIIFPGARVLDIGCGPGSYALPFALAGCEVLCVDISEGMISRLQKNIPSDLRSKIEMRILDWHSFNPEEEGYLRAFDLVFANMTPAIGGPKDLRNLNRCSRDWCHYRGWHGARTDALLDKIRVSLALNDSCGFAGNAQMVLNLLLAEGFLPKLDFLYWKKEGRVEIEKKADTMTEILSEEVPYGKEKLNKKIRQILCALADDHGDVLERSRGIIAEMRWSVKRSDS